MEANCGMKMWHIVGDLRSKLSQGFFILKETPCGILHPPATHTHTQTRTPPSLLQWSVMDVYKKGEIVCSDLCCCQIWWRGNKCLL